ncbi:MAG: hypothetical protein GY733_11195 [bacterium]|nr:hypothetical protein [bacterium]
MNWLERWVSRRGEGAGDEVPVDPEITGLVERAGALSQRIEPERDLFVGIENRIAQRRVHRAEPHASWWLSLFPRPLAAAGVAALLVATTALGVLWAVTPPGGPLSDVEAAQIAERLRGRDGVAHVRHSVVAILEARRGELPPETVAAVEQNLRNIDRAIAEIHLALESNPGHQSLGFMLAEAYGREADLLERLEWWTRASNEVQS